jgi:hypothetical protein
MNVIGGVQAEEAKEMLSNWFKQRRRRSYGTDYIGENLVVDRITG